MRMYEGAGLVTTACPAVFGMGDDVVVWTDESSRSVVVWNTRSQHRLADTVAHDTPIT